MFVLCLITICLGLPPQKSWMKMTPLPQTGNQSRVFVIESFTLLYLIPLPNFNSITESNSGNNKSISKTETNKCWMKTKWLQKRFYICQRYKYLVNACAPINSKGTLFFLWYSTITNSITLRHFLWYKSTKFVIIHKYYTVYICTTIMEIIKPAFCYLFIFFFFFFFWLII